MFTPLANHPLIKIAIIRSTSIGDVVLATACLDLLKKIPAPVQVSWVGRRPALPLIGLAYPEMKTIELEPDSPSSTEKALNELKDVHFVIDLQTNLRSQLLCRELRRRHKIASYTCDKRSLDRGTMVLVSRLRGRRKSLPASMQTAEVYQFDMMLRSLKQGLEMHLPVEMLDGLDQIKAFPTLPTAHDTGDRPWQKELKFGRWLALAPGAAHATKKAPVSLYQDILNLVSTQRARQGLDGQELGLLFVGNDEERSLALDILSKLDWRGPVLNLAGMLSLWETSLALREAEALLCNDSALLHVAEAVGVPVAAMFGPTVEAFGFPPWRPESRVFSAQLGCRPCSKHGKKECRYEDKLCFQLIQATQVATHLLGLIQGETRSTESEQHV